KSGSPAKRLNAEQWARVSGKLGYTSLMSLLYRKRIKANYRDIDTIAFAGIDALTVHSSLIHVVTATNFVHEAFVAAALGKDRYAALVAEFLSRCRLERLDRR